MKKLIALMMALVLMLTCFTACSGDPAGGTDPVQTSGTDGTTAAVDSDKAYVLNNGKLVVGITDYAPMDYKDDSGNWTGFDAEFATLFAEKLGVDVEFFVIADWSKKFYELESKNIDVIWNGMTINEDVTLNTNCSDPYVVNAQVVVMKADVVDNYTTADSMKELTVAVENGSAGQDAAEAAGVENIVPVQDQAAALMEVKAGTSDACVIDITMAKAMTGEGTNYADLAAGISLTSEEYGVGFRKGSDLTAEINAFMAELKENGKLQELATKYELTLAE